MWLFKALIKRSRLVSNYAQDLRATGRLSKKVVT